MEVHKVALIIMAHYKTIGESNGAVGFMVETRKVNYERYLLT